MLYQSGHFLDEDIKLDLALLLVYSILENVALKFLPENIN